MSEEPTDVEPTALLLSLKDDWDHLYGEDAFDEQMGNTQIALILKLCGDKPIYVSMAHTIEQHAKRLPKERQYRWIKQRILTKNLLITLLITLADSQFL